MQVIEVVWMHSSGAPLLHMHPAACIGLYMCASVCVYSVASYDILISHSRAEWGMMTLTLTRCRRKGIFEDTFVKEPNERFLMNRGPS